MRAKLLEFPREKLRVGRLATDRLNDVPTVGRKHNHDTAPVHLTS
jgi:hypothetical protein